MIAALRTILVPSAALAVFAHAPDYDDPQLLLALAIPGVLFAVIGTMLYCIRRARTAGRHTAPQYVREY